MAKERKYQQIWERIKLSPKHECLLDIPHPALFARVIKAVIKEKNKDLGFKVMNDHDNFRLEITKIMPEEGATVKKYKLKFKLKQTLVLEGVNV